MEFGWQEEEQELRRRLGEVVAAHLPSGWDRSKASLGSSSWSPESDRFAQRLAQEGLLVRSWPQEFGGQDAPAWQQLILAEVMWLHGEPRGPQYMNVNWIGPAIMRYGTPEQRRTYLPPMARGEVVWCQGFSEPDAGSDLASLRTRADRDGDEYIVNGQKIWTSYADVAQHCFLLVRTDTTQSRGRGISVLLVPMNSPGLEVRKIPAVVGEHAFHELFFTDVRVAASARLGDENDGWAIVRSALASERVGLPRYIRAAQVLDAAARWAREQGQLDDRRVLARLGEAQVACEAARLLVYRVVDERAKGSPASAHAYVARAAVVEAERAVADAVVDVMGEAGLEIGSLADSQQRNSLAVGIASGTYEVQLNLIATMLLGLPRS